MLVQPLMTLKRPKVHFGGDGLRFSLALDIRDLYYITEFHALYSFKKRKPVKASLKPKINMIPELTGAKSEVYVPLSLNSELFLLLDAGTLKGDPQQTYGGYVPRGVNNLNLLAKPIQSINTNIYLPEEHLAPESPTLTTLREMLSESE